jgi:hypothetical protein
MREQLKEGEEKASLAHGIWRSGRVLRLGKEWFVLTSRKKQQREMEKVQ